MSELMRPSTARRSRRRIEYGCDVGQHAAGDLHSCCLVLVIGRKGASEGREQGRDIFVERSREESSLARRVWIWSPCPPWPNFILFLISLLKFPFGKACQRCFMLKKFNGLITSRN